VLSLEKEEYSPADGGGGSVVNTRSHLAGTLFAWSQRSRSSVEDPRRIEVIVAAAPLGSNLLYKYRIEPEGWIAQIVQGLTEVNVTWMPRTWTANRRYVVPDESVEYLIDGKFPTETGLVRPGALVTTVSACGAPM
jgi:hypothetical protein